MALSRFASFSSVAALLLVSAITGCTTYTVPRYPVSVDNVIALRTLRGHPIAVGEFKEADGGSPITCRAAGPIATPDGDTYAEYVRMAFVSELKMAEALSPTSPITLTGTVDHVDFSSTSGEWELGLTVASSNGRSLHVAERYPFATGFLAEHACNQAAQAFAPAVQNLIADLVRKPAFAGLVAAPDDGPQAQARP